MTDLTYIGPWRTEIAVLAASVILGLAHIIWGAVAARRQQGLKWARGNREEARPVTGMAARLARAQANFIETYPYFLAALLGVVLTEAYGGLSHWGAVLWLAARTLYLPIYALGNESGLRTLVWFIGLVGLLMVLAALISGGGSALPALMRA